MKTLTLYKYGKAHPITFETHNYYNNGNLYVGLITHENGYPEPWQNLTTNLDKKCEPHCGFIDVNHNGSEILEWLFSNGLGHLTGDMKASGFVVYPEFKFNMDKLKEFMDAADDNHKGDD